MIGLPPVLLLPFFHTSHDAPTITALRSCQRRVPLLRVRASSTALIKVLLDHRPVIALVPARGGSKGVLRKNLAPLCGQPLLMYTLQAAQQSSLIDEVWLSSDDEEVLGVGRQAGVCVLHRPAEFATDQASAVGVVRHFLSGLSAATLETDPFVIYLQPTSPLRTARHIDESLAGMQDVGAQSMMSVVELKHSPYKCFRLDADGRLQSLFDEALSNARRQDLPATFLPNGAMYAFRASDFVSHGGFPSNGAWPYVMSESESVDVDTPADLRHLEQLLGAEHA